MSTTPDPPFPSAARIAAWSDFWSEGALHARSASPDENYAGPTRAFWLDVFATLPPGARVLDLCSGNGPLARLVLEAGLLRSRALELHAVDAARLAPVEADGVRVDVSHVQVRDVLVPVRRIHGRSAA